MQVLQTDNPHQRGATWITNQTRKTRINENTKYSIKIQQNLRILQSHTENVKSIEERQN